MATQIESLAAFDLRDYKAEKSLSGKVTHLYHSSETFSAGIISDPAGSLLDKDCRFKAPCRLQIGETVTLHGVWGEDKKWGWQFAAKIVEYPMPDPAESADGLANYLANNPAFKGLGPAKAKLIADAFGSDFDTVIRNDTERVALVGKITLEQADDLRSQWILRADTNAISAWLAGFGLTHGQVKKIAERYGNRARQVLTEDPYILCTEVSGFGFARTDEIALKMGIAKDHPGRIRACLRDLVENECEQGGHTYIDRKQLMKLAVAKLAFDTLEANGLISDQLDSLCVAGHGELVSVVVDDFAGTFIAPRYLYNRETDLIRWFGEANSNLPDYDESAAGTLTDAVLTSARQMPSAAQREAIQMVLRSRVSILSGGAGTGKSFTVAAIYRIFARQSKSVALAAPTGKAARRMMQLAEGAYAKTIHRLLGYNPVQGWEFNENNKLPQDLIIIDEVSMCDVTLLWRLFSAIDLQRTQVLLVGDHNQLPPIGPGNVLRDVLAAGILPYHILTECIRAAGELKINCNALLHGDINPTTDVLAGGGREWRLVDNLEDPEYVIDALRRLMSTKFAEWGFDPISECQIITPYNKGKLGVARINAEMQRIWQKQSYGVELPEVPSDAEPRLRIYAGDKVMQIKNDYQLGGGVMNGTQGIVTAIDRDGADGKGAMIIQFDDRDLGDVVEIEIGSDAAANIVLAYACTIHKTQGSEYQCVVAVIHRTHAYMLSRNLIYTAATRAKKTAILVGDKVGMRRAARTTTPMERRTWMSLGVM
jgi:exodeoxyribonuclease V alpha subunit